MTSGPKTLLLIALLSSSDPGASDRTYAGLSELLKAEPDCSMMADSCIMCVLGPKGIVCTPPFFACVPDGKWRCTASGRK
jgi:hypothetical protein